MATLVIMMYVLCGATTTLIVLTSCKDILQDKDEITKIWTVAKWVLAWPYKLYRAFHDGVMIYDAI